jgi:uncharacterized protein YggU (UPF0235/DUF167 family)
MNESFFSMRNTDILVRVKAKPGARSDGVLGVRAGELLVGVRAAPEKGRANDALILILSETLGVKRGDIILKTGAGSPRKQFTVPLSARFALESLRIEGKA